MSVVPRSDRRDAYERQLVRAINGVAMALSAAEDAGLESDVDDLCQIAIELGRIFDASTRGRQARIRAAAAGTR